MLAALLNILWWALTAFALGVALVLGLATGTVLLASIVAVASPIVFRLADHYETDLVFQQRARTVLNAVCVLIFAAFGAWLTVEFFTTADPICDGCPGY